MKIAVVYSLTTARAKRTAFAETEEDTEISAHEVAEALRSKGHTVSLIPVSEKTIHRIDAIDRDTDCIFDMIEWTSADLVYAEPVVKRIERCGIPFTGATWNNYLLVSDKLLSKRAFDAHHIPSPRWQKFMTGRERVVTKFDYPVIVKLSLEHCSVGLEHDAVVESAEALKKIVQQRIKKFKEPVYAEEFIEGRELQVTMLEVDGVVRALPPAEIFFDEKGSRAFLTYESRWDVNHPDYSKSEVDVAEVSPELLAKVTEVCTRLFTELGYRDYARIDLRVRGNEVFVLEANCNPGLGDCEECAMTVSYSEADMSFADFVDAIVASCMRRFVKKRTKNV